MEKTHLEELSLPYPLKCHKPYNLRLVSPALKGNPLGDYFVRHNYVLVPKGVHKNWPLVFHLSGYFSTGYQNFSPKTLNHSMAEQIDGGVATGLIPQAVHVFVEADTYWGGSQFINSPGCGKYRDYILNDLYPQVVKNFPVMANDSFRCVMGGSSGGYGALQLISDKKSPFGIAGAIAPDSYFQASLFPELLSGAPELLKYKKFSQIKEKISHGEIQDKKSFFPLVHMIAMGFCYSPKESLKKDFLDFPIDLYSGELKSKIWKQWLKHDPIYFLPKRIKYLKNKNIILDVGLYDNFSLQYGARQISSLLKKNKIKHEFTEFPGNHFGLSLRKVLFLQKLARPWKKFLWD